MKQMCSYRKDFETRKKAEKQIKNGTKVHNAAKASKS